MSVQVQHRRDANATIEGITPAVGEIGYDTTKGELLIGNGALAGGIRQAKKNTSEILVAAQLVANTNDYSPAGLKHAGALLISTDASRDITGLVPVGAVDTVDGREIVIYNAGAFNAVLKDQNAASTAANRFDLGGADITLQPKSSVTLRYRTQGTLNRWEVKASTAGAAIADGSVIARKLAASSMPLVGMINGTLVPSVAGSALTIALKTLAGGDPSAADPVYAIFRNATATNGDFTVLTITAAASLVISSGSSMGVAANNTAFRLWIVGFNDAGTFRLGAINCLSGTDIYPLAGWGIATSTAEGGAGAADNAQTFYTGTAVAAKAYVPLGYVTWETGLAATGAWSAAPTRSQLYGAGVPLPGAVIGSARTDVGTTSTGTTLVPQDNTIPQSTEGDQFLSKSYTPQSAANLLDVKAQAIMFSSVGGQSFVLSLYQDSGANALKVAAAGQFNTGNLTELSLNHCQLAGLSTSTAFKVRAGQATAGTLTFNASLYGGTLNSFLEIMERMS